MEETLERPSWLAVIASKFTSRRDDVYYEEEQEADYVPAPSSRTRALNSYRINIRRQVETMDDALEAADGLRLGEQQVLNLNFCAPQLREKIKDFLQGVNYAMEGDWIEVGENVFLLAPNTAEVDVVPAHDGVRSKRN